MRNSAQSLAAAFGLLACLSGTTHPAVALAQSPSTGSIVILVLDQTGRLVRDAKVTLTNTSTSAVREAVSNDDGSVTMPTLPLTGEYKISVTKPGFTAEDVPGLMLRAGETAKVRVRLLATGGKSE